MTLVDIGVACSSVQFPNWWVHLISELVSEIESGIKINNIFAISSALPDHNKNHTITSAHSNKLFSNPEQKKRGDLTDANREEITTRFMDSDSEWLWQIDDDTVPPKGALTKLLKHRRDFVGGIYFNPKYPYNPIAYVRRPDGLYHAYYGYAKGTLVPVDSIGMGCTLIHKSVFEKIMEEHVILQRPNGSIYPIHKSNVRNTNAPKLGKLSDSTKEVYYQDGWLCTRAEEVTDPEDNRPWPFYALEFGRTEDHHFCELAGNVGIKPYLDTKIVCDHYKPKPTGETKYLREFYKKLGVNVEAINFDENS